MKISVITAVLNNKDFIEGCIRSVRNQSYKNIEHIIIDGASTDGTLDIINNFRDGISRVVSEKDSGMYHAINKGIGLAGGDVIAILNADDFYPDENIIEEVAGAFEEYGTDAVYGDIIYVSKADAGKIVRYWKAGPYNKGAMRTGWMPPHPAFFVKKNVYEKYGLFNTDFRIAADYEICIRFLYKYGISLSYLPRVLVKMRLGGRSNATFSGLLLKSAEDFRAWKSNGLKASPATIILKNAMKIPQFIIR